MHQLAEYEQTVFFEPLHEWLERAEIEQVSRLREHIDLAIVMKEDALNQEEAMIKQKRARLKVAKKALGIKKKYATRKDKGTKRKVVSQPKPDQVTE